jgi:dihydroneopterin triphosphate diphosphatase
MNGKYRRAVFIVVYSLKGNKVEFLILRRKLHWIGWEFPKGGVEFLETNKRALKREVLEETGLSSVRIEKFKVEGRYKYEKEFPDRKGFVGQTFKLFSAEVKKGRVKLDKLEHSGYKWLSFEKAVKKLKWPNQKKCLRIVNESLRKG